MVVSIFKYFFIVSVNQNLTKPSEEGCHESIQQLLVTIKVTFKLCGFQIYISSIESETLHQGKHRLYFYSVSIL